MDAIRKVNAVPQPIEYIPWQFNDVAGHPVVSPIFDKIDDSAFLVADITFINLNVIYEIAYCIGKKKRAFLVRSSKITGDRALAKDVGIFDTLGYWEYTDFQELQKRLAADIDEKSMAFDLALDKRAPIYVVEPPLRGEAVTITISRIKKTGLQYRSYNPSEDPRLSALDAIKQVSSSSGIVSFLQPDQTDGAQLNNVRSMFVCGLAHGMGKPFLLLAQENHNVPMDVRDTVEYYRDENSIRDLVAKYAPKFISFLQDTEESQTKIVTKLAALTVGDPTAENEMSTLQEYYLQTDTFSRSTRGEVNLVVGRKGAGKTALFIRLRDKIRSNKQNIVVDLKPEGFQLMKLKEEMLSYLAEGARHHLLIAFWEYLILLEVAYKLLEKDQNVHKFNHDLHDLYLDLKATYTSGGLPNEGDFSERLLVLSGIITQKYSSKFGNQERVRLTNEDVTELLHIQDIPLLRSKISKYLQFKGSTWVLFDNLDKGWNTQGVTVIDAIIMRCLIDAGRRVEREMKRNGREFHCLIFIRNDVYDHVMKNSADYGKEMRATIDWTDHDLLRELLRLRLVSGLPDAKSESNFDEIWTKVCVQLCQGEDTSEMMIRHSLMRPRNLLKLFNHCKGYAVNFGHSIIMEDDIAKGLKAYSQDLLSELDHELMDVFPAAKNAIYQFIDCDSQLSETEIKVLLREADIRLWTHKT